MGTKLELEVSSVANIPYLVYTVVAHGGIVRMQHIKVPDNQKTFTLEITPTLEMNPHFIVYVHYIQNGQLHYDEMQLELPQDFENQVGKFISETLSDIRNQICFISDFLNCPRRSQTRPRGHTKFKGST